MVITSGSFVLQANWKPDQHLVFTLSCQALVSGGSYDGWILWSVSLPMASPRPMIERMVSHWLRFYNDEDLEIAGMTLIDDVFQALPKDQPIQQNHSNLSPIN